MGAVGQFSFYRSWHHQNFRRVGWGPHRHNSQSPIPARLSDQNANFLTELFSDTVRAGEINVDKTFPPKTLDRSRDSSDFDFAKVLARGRSRATHSDCDTGSEQDRLSLSNLQPAADTRTHRSTSLTKSTALYAMYDVTLRYVPPQRI